MQYMGHTLKNHETHAANLQDGRTTFSDVKKSGGMAKVIVRLSQSPDWLRPQCSMFDSGPSINCLISRHDPPSETTKSLLNRYSFLGKEKSEE
jgi:hypothetical protein